MSQYDNSGMILDLGYRTILELLPCYVSIQDRSLRILFANQSLKNDFGETTGKLCHEVYIGSAERCKSCPVQQSFKDKKVHSGEQTVHLSSGEFAQMIVHAAPILDVHGNVTAAIELSTNITKVKEMLKELTFLGQSIAILSHDIKNILEGLQGGAYVVDEGIKDGDMKLAVKGWDIVKKNISEISHIAQNVLFASKKKGPEYKKASPYEIVDQVVRLFQEKAKAMNIHLRHQANPALPLINLDAVSIRRMLTNILWNALQACLKDKEKELHTVIIRADFYDRLHFMFEVEDDGVGMDEATKKKIFGEYYSTKGSDGTGLGLLVVNKIVKEHGGRVEVLTTPGKGSTFRIILRMR